MRNRLVALLVSVLITASCGAPSAIAASAFADPAFQTQWGQGEAITPNFWGPLTNAKDGQQEPYKDAQGGQRLVQYFDKARMEKTNGVLTNGLLTVELKSGRVQVGDATFEQRQPAKINLAGDPGESGPTYADLSQLAERTPRPSGGIGLFPPTYIGSGHFKGYDERVDHLPFDLVPKTGDYVSYVDDPSGHYGTFVYQPFLDFIHSLPFPLEQATGYPISSFFFAQVKIGGAPIWVLVQPFERRVLTYNPNNPVATRVEFGNIGQHYYQWRYGGNSPAPPASATATPPSASAIYPGKIVYETGTGDRNAPVYVMNADGSGKVKVGDGRSPVFSPDGNRVAYYFQGSPIPDSPGSNAAIRSVNLDGSVTKDEATFGVNSFLTLVRWSPSGHYIAVNHTQNGPGAISLFDTTTGKTGDSLKYLQGDVSLIFDWTPDGSNALWQASLVYGDMKNLYFGNPDTRGDGALQLTHGENQIVRDPFHYYACARISPDGKTIAVAGTKVFFLSVPGQVSPLDGKSLDGLSDVYSLSWSPDGRALAVATGQQFSPNGTGRTLSVVDIASSQVITTVPGAGRADWSRQ